MTIRIRKFRGFQEAEDFINDVMVGAKSISSVAPVNLDGLTMTFTTPLKTVTFSGAALRANEIVDQINTELGVTGAAIRQLFSGDTNRIALVIDGHVLTGGTALGALGLSAGTVGADKIALAKLHSVGTMGMSGDTFFVVYEE